jgi:hypothetical protein
MLQPVLSFRHCSLVVSNVLPTSPSVPDVTSWQVIQSSECHNNHDVVVVMMMMIVVAAM